MPWQRTSKATLRRVQRVTADNGRAENAIVYTSTGPPKPFSRPAAALPGEPRYMAATGEYYHPRPLAGPSQFQRARQPTHPDAPVLKYNEVPLN